MGLDLVVLPKSAALLKPHSLQLQLVDIVSFVAVQLGSLLEAVVVLKE